jgi:hypothetical protein
VRVCAPSGERARSRSNSRTRSNECPACPRRVRSARPRAPDQPHGSTLRPATRAPRSTAPGLTGVPGLAVRAVRRRAHRWRLRAQRRRVAGSQALGCWCRIALPQRRRLLAQQRRVAGSAAAVAGSAAAVAGSAAAGCWLYDAGLRTLRRGIRDGASGFANSPPYKQNPPTQGGKTSPLVSLGVAGDSFGVVRAGLWMSRANVDNSKNRARTAESPRARGRNAGAGGISTGADRGVSARKL